MSAFGPVFSLLLLLACGTAAPGVARKQQSVRKFPSANCTTRCGDLAFDFPFGVGPGCFRQPDFELICDNTRRPSRLFLKDRVWEVVSDIYASQEEFDVTFSHALSAQPGVDVYNISLVIPGSTFGLYDPWITIRGCNVDAYLLSNSSTYSSETNSSTDPVEHLCRAACGDEGTLDTPWESCNGTARTGCCSAGWPGRFDNNLVLQIVRDRSSIHSTMSVTVHSQIAWNIMDRQTCAAGKDDKASYACVSKHSNCESDNGHFDLGYKCSCNDGYIGNPYTLYGCSRDHGYSPTRLKRKCSHSCGNISVPFPFGLEEGCSARKIFQLNCTDASSSKLEINDGRYVTKIYVNEGLMDIRDTIYDKGIMPWTVGNEKNILFISSRDSTTLQWVAASLSCQEAQENKPTYACVSNNSTCLGINSTFNYLGYYCKCEAGFTGNPYVLNGCEDIDECKSQPGICKGVCRNTNGSYSCDKCPGKTEYDSTKMKCISAKREIVLLGVGVGIGAGFGFLLLGLTAIYLTHRWRRDHQKKLRRKYFAKNQGLLLEQLISSDENASDKTKIFSLEELEKATNNFDDTLILGHGGHGMVYKGILSDQRVVAIKKSKDIKQSEINEFINEVAILSQINHRNIVKLYGCCLESQVPLLVYDFVQNGSLSQILHSVSSDSFSLSWDDCLRIATETASALYYLHSAASISVFHRDVKSSNILLDANYTAKVSDFGASRLVPIDQTHVSTNVQGTFGYLDPEYYHTRQLNEKSDVYSFGVLLLEILLRMKPIFTSESGSKQSLSSYFLGELKKRPIKEIVDAQVQEEATEEEINNVSSLVEMCLRLRGEERPTMKEVEMSLQLLRSKRLKSSYQQRTRAEAGIQSHASYTIIDPISANSNRCYSLELELMSSASLPR